MSIPSLFQPLPLKSLALSHCGPRLKVELESISQQEKSSFDLTKEPKLWDGVVFSAHRSCMGLPLKVKSCLVSEGLK